MSYDYIIKIIMIGESGSGKSAILTRHFDDQFKEDDCSTIGVDFRITTLAHEDDLVRVQIWDTAGQERFSSITEGYFRGANGAIVVYDATDILTFQKSIGWLERFRAITDPRNPVLLVANKCEDEARRVITTSEGENLATGFGNCRYAEVSAKTGKGVTDALVDFMKTCCESLSSQDKDYKRIVNKSLDDDRKHDCCSIM